MISKGRSIIMPLEKYGMIKKICQWNEFQGKIVLSENGDKKAGKGFISLYSKPRYFV